MGNKRKIIDIAKEQLALDYNCKKEDFDKDENIIVLNDLVEGRRIKASEDSYFRAVCIGGKAIINVGEELLPWFKEKYRDFNCAWFFEYENLKRIESKLKEVGHEIEDIHHYYLPLVDMDNVEPIMKVKWYEKDGIFQFEDDVRFGEALMFDEENPDALAVAAFDGDEIVAMAGASEDCSTMWQIGVNVVPSYRGRGIASNLVTLLKQEVLKRGKIPFTGTVESHFNSQNVSLNSGFRPIWGEIHSNSID